MTQPSSTPAIQLIPDALVERVHDSGAGMVVASEGLEVLVPGALPGARGELEYSLPAAGGRRGLANKWREISPSPFADPNRCPHARGKLRCGGCPLGGIEYAKELELKTECLVNEPLRSIGLLRPGLIAPAAGEPQAQRTEFRNKAVLYPGIIDGRGRFGYYAARTQALVPAEDCPQTPAWMGEAARRLQPFLTDGTLTPAPESELDRAGGVLRNLLMREAPGTKERMLVLTVKTLEPVLAGKERILKELEPLGLEAILVNLHPGRGSAVFNFDPAATHVLAGNTGIKARLMGLNFALGPQTFLQVNTPQTPVLYEKALAAADIAPEENVLDLYCGVGTITLLAAGKAFRGQVFGVERVAASVECARENALKNGFSNTGFAALAVEDFLAQALEKGFPGGFSPDKIIVDPAYQGLGGGSAQALAKVLEKYPVKRLVYVSCNPKSFARDALVVCGSGFALELVEPVDLFPGAMHLEIVASFVRTS